MGSKREVGPKKSMIEQKKTAEQDVPKNVPQKQAIGAKNPAGYVDIVSIAGSKTHVSNVDFVSTGSKKPAPAAPAPPGYVDFPATGDAKKSVAPAPAEYVDLVGTGDQKQPAPAPPGYVDFVSTIPRKTPGSHVAGSEYMVVSEKERASNRTAENAVKTPRDSSKKDVSPYLVLSEKEKFDPKKPAEFQKVGAKRPTELKSKKAPKMPESTKLIRRKRSPSSSSRTKRTNLLKKRNRFFRMALVNEKDEPELCPRIFAVVLIWIVMVMGIIGYGYFQGNWFERYKRNASEPVCYAAFQLKPHRASISSSRAEDTSTYVSTCTSSSSTSTNTSSSVSTTTEPSTQTTTAQDVSTTETVA